MSAPPNPADHRRVGRVLVLASRERDASLICRVLGESGVQAEVCGDMAELCRGIRDGAGAVVLAEETLSGAARARLEAALEAQPSWSEVPLIVLLGRGASDRRLGRGAGGLEGRTSLSLLERPLHVASLVSTVDAALRARHRQHQVRDELQRRRAAEGALRESERRLAELNATLERQVAERSVLAERRARDLRRLAAELHLVEHRERERLAGVLHDELQQLLFAAKTRLPSQAQREGTPWHDRLDRVEALLDQSLAVSRHLGQELSPRVLDVGTLPDILEWVGDWFGENHGLDVTLEVEGRVPRVAKPLRLFFYQAVRELLLNVVKHAEVDEARLTLSARRGRLILEVADGGRGFDPAVVDLERPRGFGLFGIRERLAVLGGRLEMESVPGGGARFRLIVPVPRQSSSSSKKKTTSRRAPRRA